MKSRTKLGFAALGAATLSLGLTSALPAFADTSAQSNDAVVVGSDTLQFASSFIADGDPNGDAGYNSGTFNRIFDFYSTGDANGRFTVAGGVSGTPGASAETAVLRSGTAPVLRPNGSGAGVAALTLDSPATSAGPSGGGYQGLTPGSISLARMSRMPNATEIANCDALKGCGGLHVYEIANDTLGIAATTGTSGTKPTNAVALNATQLWNIYNCTNTAAVAGNPNAGDFTHWNSAQIGGTSTDSIIPVIPQSGSGTRTFFLATIDSASGHTSDPSLSSTCVKTAQEHDPTGITGQATAANPNGAADAIEPFSQARLNLINGNDITQGTAGIGQQFPYFSNSGGAAGTPATGYAVNSLAIVGSTSTTTAFSTVRAVYIVARQADVLNTTCSAKTAPTCFLPGGKQTQLQALIASGANSVYGGGSYASNISYAGFTPKFQDCQVDPNSGNSCATAP